MKLQLRGDFCKKLTLFLYIYITIPQFIPCLSIAAKMNKIYWLMLHQNVNFMITKNFIFLFCLFLYDYCQKLS